MNFKSSLSDAIIQFYLENPQACIKILQDVQSKDSDILKQRDIFMFRSYIAQNKFSVPLDEISPSTPNIELKSLRLLAKYLSDYKQRSKVVADIDELLGGSLGLSDETVLIVAATIYLHEKKMDLALKVLHNGGSLECRTLTIQTLLQMHRYDLAQKELKKMVEVNEDDILTQLATAMVHLSIGGEKVREAIHIYDELSEKYQTTSNLIHNGKAAAYLALNDLEKADVVLHEAMDRNPNDPDTIINMIVLCHMTGKPLEVTNRYLSDLKDSNPYHPFVQDYLSKEAEFDRLAAHYGSSVHS